MAPPLTAVIPVWDKHVELLPRCLRAIENEHLDTKIVLVNNASHVPLDGPPGAELVTLSTRQTIGAARNAGLARVTTPYVLFADADDEVIPGALTHSLALLHEAPAAPGVIGRSIVDEDGQWRRRGRTPRFSFFLASHVAPHLTPLFWLGAFQASLTSTALRTSRVREAGGWPDSNIGEDWRLAARMARRSHFLCLSEPVRVYYRHPEATRNRVEDARARHDLHRLVCAECRCDPAANRTQRLLAAAISRWISGGTQ